MCQVSFCLKHNTPKKNGQIPAMCRIAFVKNRYFPTRFGLRACSKFQTLKISKPETPSFKAWNTQFQGLEHLVSRPGTPRLQKTKDYADPNTLEHPVSRPGTPRLQKTKDYADPNTLPASYSKVGTTGQPSSSHVISTRNSLLAPSIRL